MTTPYSGRAIGALVTAIASAIVVAVSVVPGLIIAVLAIVLALLSRRELKERDDLRGFGLSLAGFLVGAWVVLFNGVPMLISALVLAAAWPR